MSTSSSHASNASTRSQDTQEERKQLPESRPVDASLDQEAALGPSAAEALFEPSFDDIQNRDANLKYRISKPQLLSYMLLTGFFMLGIRVFAIPDEDVPTVKDNLQNFLLPLNRFLQKWSWIGWAVQVLSSLLMDVVMFFFGVSLYKHGRSARIYLEMIALYSVRAIFQNTVILPFP